MSITFAEYQAGTSETAIYPGKGIIEPGVRPSDESLIGLLYIICGKMGELGEVAEKIKKVIRDKDAVFSKEAIIEIAKELGDEAWYNSELASKFGLNLGDIALGNLAKLRSRKDRGVLGGSGDNR